MRAWTQSGRGRHSNGGTVAVCRFTNTAASTPLGKEDPLGEKHSTAVYGKCKLERKDCAGMFKQRYSLRLSKVKNIPRRFRGVGTLATPGPAGRGPKGLEEGS